MALQGVRVRVSFWSLKSFNLWNSICQRAAVLKKIIMRKKMFLFWWMVILFASSCSPKIEFTQKIREDYKISPEMLSKLQFYISDELRLSNISSTKTGADIVDEIGRAHV